MILSPLVHPANRWEKNEQEAATDVDNKDTQQASAEHERTRWG